MIHYKTLHCRGRGSHSLLSLLLYILIWLYLSSSVPLINMKRLCSFISASEELWSPWLQPCSFTFTISLVLFSLCRLCSGFSILSFSTCIFKTSIFSISPYCTWCKANNLKGSSPPLFPIQGTKGVWCFWACFEVKTLKMLQVQGWAVLLVVLATSHLHCKIAHTKAQNSCTESLFLSLRLYHTAACKTLLLVQGVLEASVSWGLWHFKILPLTSNSLAKSECLWSWQWWHRTGGFALEHSPSPWSFQILNKVRF